MCHVPFSRDPDDDGKGGSQDPVRDNNTGSGPRHGIPADQLLLAVESELIPRLMLSARLAAATPASDAQAAATVVRAHSTEAQRADIYRLVDLARRSDGPGMDRIVNAAVDSGVDIQRVFLDLLAPAARQLGDDWLDDRISFVDVHIGLLALRQVVARYEVAPTQGSVAERSVLLSSAPEDQHSFGVTLVSDCFQRAGWHVRNECGASVDELRALVSEDAFSCVGFSLYCDDRLDTLRQCISSVRLASQNQELLILVGGSSFAELADPAGRVGADLYLESAELAVGAATTLLDARATIGTGVSCAELQEG